MKDAALAQLRMACIEADASLEVRAVAIRHCRDVGCSWAEIGAACGGISRQTAHKRYGHLVGEPDRSVRRRAERLEAVANGEPPPGPPDPPPAVWS